MTRSEINANIDSINELFLDFVEYNDSIEFTDSNEKDYVTSDTLLDNVKKANYNAIQYLEELKKESLTEFNLTIKQDTTLFNLCFEIYQTVTDDYFDSLIKANDLDGFNRTDIDPNCPLIKKGTKIIYYK